MRTDIAPTSGAAVLEVDIPTGYHTQKQVLRRHQWTGPIHSLRSRFVHQKVVLYFEFVSIRVHVPPLPRRLVPESVYAPTPRHVHFTSQIWLRFWNISFIQQQAKWETTVSYIQWRQLLCSELFFRHNGGCFIPPKTISRAFFFSWTIVTFDSARPIVSLWLSNNCCTLSREDSMSIWVWRITPDLFRKTIICSVAVGPMFRINVRCCVECYVSLHYPFDFTPTSIHTPLSISTFQYISPTPSVSFSDRCSIYGTAQNRESKLCVWSLGCVTNNT